MSNVHHHQREERMSQQQMEPIEAARARARSLESTLDSVGAKATLATVFDALEDIDSQLGALPGRIEKLRNRGYAFKSFLEAQVEAIKNEWPATRHRVAVAAEEQRPTLMARVEGLHIRFGEARSLVETDPAQAQAVLGTLEATASALDRSANSAISSLNGMYDSLRSRLNRIEGELHKVERVLDQVDQASFKLFPDEYVVDAVEAQWLTDQKGGPKGVLYCTDHRLLFEQKEEIATKRVFFVVTEKQKVQKLLMEVPIGAVQQATES